MLDLFGLCRSHFLELGFGCRIKEHARQHFELGTQPPHFARGSSDGLDRSIVLRQSHEFVGREVARRHGIGEFLPPRLDRGDPF